MKRIIMAGALLGLGFFFSMLGCTRASVVCDLICTCEHCNTQAETEACNGLATAEDVADAYGCTDKWETYTVCIEERGKCDETESRFSTRDDRGNDRCQDEVDAYNECINKASAHDGPSGGIN
ncbi:MAG TPA: hypothetical protein PK156_42310 [Polyangium sp.]|nr:hypothetical protein [Polyangium sp.]